MKKRRMSEGHLDLDTVIKRLREHNERRLAQKRRRTESMDEETIDGKAVLKKLKPDIEKQVDKILLL